MAVHREPVRLFASPLPHRQSKSSIWARQAEVVTCARDASAGRLSRRPSDSACAKESPHSITVRARPGVVHDGSIDVAGMLGLPVHEVAFATVGLGESRPAHALVVVDQPRGVVAIDRPLDQAVRRIDDASRGTHDRHRHGQAGTASAPRDRIALAVRSRGRSAHARMTLTRRAMRVEAAPAARRLRECARTTAAASATDRAGS